MVFTIRRRIAVIGSAVLTLVAFAQSARAQSSDAAGWGFEGRAGSANGAYLVRHFSSNWSALLGGNFDYSKQDRDDAAATSTSSYNLTGSFILRRAWGAGRVRPFIGLGPILSTNRQETKPGPSSPTPQFSSKSEGWGIGGRGEFGGIVPVTSGLSFGLLMNVNVNSLHMEASNSGSTTKAKTDILQSSIGGLQFLASVKF